MADRKYGQDEIQRILKKAAEKQQKAQEFSRPVVGLSIEEIERIAAEAGIDPRFVREAAWESKTIDDDRRHSRWLGGMSSMKVGRSIPAVVSESELDTELVPVIREQSGKTGQFEKLGKILTWTDNESQAASYSKVQVTSKDGVTDIAVETTKTFHQTAYAILIIPVLMLLFLAAGIGKNGLDTPSIVFALLFIGTALAMRLGYSSFARKLEQRLENVTNALEDKVLEIGTRSKDSQQDREAKELTTEANVPLLDLESDEDVYQQGSRSVEHDRNRDAS